MFTEEFTIYFYFV